MKNTLLILSLVLTSSFLSGCAVPLRSQEMMPQFDFYDQVSSQMFEDAVYIRNIEVADGVGGVMPVTPEEYRTTLVSSFRQADLYSKEDEAKYFLDALMTELDMPFMGFNMTVTAKADYSIYAASNNELVYQESVSVPCTKGISDAFYGEVRLRLASGCAVGENITHLIKVLSTK